MSLLLDRGSSENTVASRWEQSLFRVALLPAASTAGFAIVAVLVTLLTAGSQLTGVFGAIGSVWLAVHQVPVYIGGTDLGALPLLPTLLLFAGVARCAHRFVGTDASPTRQLKTIGAAVAGPLAITVVALALIEDASAALAVSGPGPLPSLAGVAAINGVAAAFGVGLHGFWAHAERWGLPAWLLVSMRAGALGALAMFSAGALLVVLGMFLGWTEVADMLGSETTVIGQVGLLLLSIMYLPNVMVAGSAVLAGSTAHIGEASYSLFTVLPGPVPAVPVLGALPQGQLGGLWPLLLGVCAAIGVSLGWRYRAVAQTALDQLRFFVAAGAVAAMICLALGFLASGEMGSFGDLGVDPPVFALFVFGWVTVAGLAVALASAAVVRWRVARGEHAGGEYEESDYREPDYAESDTDEPDNEEADDDESDDALDSTDSDAADSDSMDSDEDLPETTANSDD